MTNAVFEQYLRGYINDQQDDWYGYLLLAEFAYNNGYQETIKNTPFFANYGINPEIRGDRSSETGKANETRRNDAVT